MKPAAAEYASAYFRGCGYQGCVPLHGYFDRYYRSRSDINLVDIYRDIAVVTYEQK